MNDIIASLLRFALAAFAGWFATQSGYEIAAGDPATITVLQFIGGLVVVAITVALKFASGTKYGPMISLLVGPRVIHISHSIARLLVGLIAGGVAALAGSEQLSNLDPDLGDNSVVGLVVLLGGLFLDRVSKKLKP
jgi:hypothetical protein